MDKIRFWAILMAGSLLGAACSSGQNTSSQTNKPTTVTIATVSTPATLDAEFSGGNPQSWEVATNCYDSLLGFPVSKDSAGNTIHDFTKVVGRLAERADVSADGMVWTLHIRHGVKDSAGNELTADDVKWSYDRSYALNGNAKYLGSLSNMPSGNDDGITVIDKYTVQFRLVAPSPTFEKQLTYWVGPIYNSTIVKAHATASDPWAKDWLKTNCAGYGPYTTLSFDPGNQVVLKSNPNFWERRPQVDTIIYKAIPEAANRVATLERGDVDIAMLLTSEQSTALKSQTGITVHQYPGNVVVPLYMNEKIKPFDDVRVRQALSYAIDYNTIITDIYHGFAHRIQSAIPSTIPGYDNSYWPYDFNLSKAKQLLTEAGFPNGFSFTVTLALLSAEMQNVAVFVQSSLEKINVHMTLDIESPAAFQTVFRAHTKPAYMFTIGSHLIDPAFAMYISFATGLPLNAASYSNPSVDALLKDAATQQDAQKRLQDIKDLQKTIVGDAPWLFLATEDLVISARSNISGIGWYPDSAIRWQYLQKS